MYSKKNQSMPDPGTVTPSTMPTVPAPVPIPMPTPRKNSSTSNDAKNTKDSDPTQ